MGSSPCTVLFCPQSRRVLPMIRLAVDENFTLLREELCRILREKDDLKPVEEATAVRPHGTGILWPPAHAREKESMKKHSSHSLHSLEISPASRLNIS